MPGTKTDGSSSFDYTRPENSMERKCSLLGVWARRLSLVYVMASNSRSWEYIGILYMYTDVLGCMTLFVVSLLWMTNSEPPFSFAEPHKCFYRRHWEGKISYIYYHMRKYTAASKSKDKVFILVYMTFNVRGLLYHCCKLLSSDLKEKIGVRK